MTTTFKAAEQAFREALERHTECVRILTTTDTTKGERSDLETEMEGLQARMLVLECEDAGYEEAAQIAEQVKASDVSIDVFIEQSKIWYEKDFDPEVEADIRAAYAALA